MGFKIGRREFIKGVAVASAAPSLGLKNVGVAQPTTGFTSEPFTVWSTDGGFTLPEIVVQYDSAAGTGVNWIDAEALGIEDRTIESRVRDAVVYLREGVEKMTGQTLTVANRADLTDAEGIILTTYAGAPTAWQNDPVVLDGVGDPGAEEDREAYYIRTENDRVVIIANHVEGLICAVPDLLESVGYELLGFSANWIYAPDYTNGLAFDLEKANHPGWLIRRLAVVFGQADGQGSIKSGHGVTLTAPDEYVEVSRRRWELGWRMATRSIDFAPGHALHKYHDEVRDLIQSTGDPEGFLAPTSYDLSTARPAASPENTDHIWFNSDNDDVYVSNGEEWLIQDHPSGVLPAALDITSPVVRNVILTRNAGGLKGKHGMIRRANVEFEENPDDVFGFVAEPEDGAGMGKINLAAAPDWYPAYMDWNSTLNHGGEDWATSNLPYVLDGFKEADEPNDLQPSEIWDPLSQSDQVFGMCNWLLAEYDAYIDNLDDQNDDYSDPENPVIGRNTSTGKSKKDLIRVDVYSYNFHDVPPNFNLDQRIRVQIAGYPKHRGTGKWTLYKRDLEMAAAFQKMLPGGISGIYRITSYAKTQDFQITGAVLETPGVSPKGRAQQIRTYHAAGSRAFNAETDLTYGKLGLTYYMMSKALWKPDMTDQEIESAIDAYLEKAFGPGWEIMREYYDLAWSGEVPVSNANVFAKCIEKINEADVLIDAGTQYQARLDDLKLHWRHYYFLDTGAYDAPSEELREFCWKGQMAYQVGLRFSIAAAGLAEAPFRAVDAAGQFITDDPRFTASEIAPWWSDDVSNNWEYIDVDHYAADGNVLWGTQTPTADVDLNDLVSVLEFGDAPAEYSHTRNFFGQNRPSPTTIAHSTGQEIGFYLFWENAPTMTGRGPVDVLWGMSWYDSELKEWVPLIDQETNVTFCQQVTVFPPAGEPFQRNVIEVRVPAPYPGVFRFDVGKAGNICSLVDLNWDIEAYGTGLLKNQGAPGSELGGKLTFHYQTGEFGPDGFYFMYVPKGVEWLDFAILNPDAGGKKIEFYDGVSTTLVKTVDIPQFVNLHRINLATEGVASGSIIKVVRQQIPYFYSIPMLWAKSRSQLLIPRMIADADGLTFDLPTTPETELAAFDHFVERGSIVGVGPGRSGDLKVRTFRELLVRAIEDIDQGDPEGALLQLSSLQRHIHLDGDVQSTHFITGEDAVTLDSLIEKLKQQLADD